MSCNDVFQATCGNSHKEFLPGKVYVLLNATGTRQDWLSRASAASTLKQTTFNTTSSKVLCKRMSFSFKSRRMCSPPHPEGEKERGAAGTRRATLFLSFFCRRRRQVLAE